MPDVWIELGKNYPYLFMVAALVLGGWRGYYEFGPTAARERDALKAQLAQERQDAAEERARLIAEAAEDRRRLLVREGELWQLLKDTLKTTQQTADGIQATAAATGQIAAHLTATDLPPSPPT